MTVAILLAVRLSMMELIIGRTGFNKIDMFMFVVILLLLFGIVEPQGWNTMLDYAQSLIPQLSIDRDYSESVSFHLWTRSNVENSILLEVGDSRSLKNSGFHSSKTTLVISHGFLNGAGSPIIQNIKGAALQNHDVNVIGVDWSKYAMNPNYLSAASNVRGVGHHVAKLVLYVMKETGSPAKNIHLIGHSLGAHVSGYAGKALRAHGNQVGRISGLDPALPGFYTADKHERLDSKDADFVDCIYTSKGTYGYSKSIGHANFYPNDGFLQPSCFLYDVAGGVCSHLVVYDYYSESVNATHIFEADNCTELDQFQWNCRLAFMGYHADPKIHGIFYLKTRASRPYALKIERHPTRWADFQ